LKGTLLFPFCRQSPPCWSKVKISLLQKCKENHEFLRQIVNVTGLFWFESGQKLWESALKWSQPFYFQSGNSEFESKIKRKQQRYQRYVLLTIKIFYNVAELLKKWLF
jgi:hypothetical protein